MTRFVLAPAAERDIEAILRWSHEQFGDQARVRYEALLVQAMYDIADDPERFGSQRQPEIADTARTYHLRHSRNRIGLTHRVGRPRHFLIYRTGADGQVEVGRVLHDCMALAQHLPNEYRAPLIEDE